MGKVDNYEYTTVQQSFSFLDLKEVGKIEYHQTKTLIFHTIRKKGNGAVPEEELRKYVKVEFINRFVDWYRPAEFRYTKTKFPARACSEKDFGNDARSKKLFKDWTGFRLYCPDISTGKSLFL